MHVRQISIGIDRYAITNISKLSFKTLLFTFFMPYLLLCFNLQGIPSEFQFAIALHANNDLALYLELRLDSMMTRSASSSETTKHLLESAMQAVQLLISYIIVLQIKLLGF